MIAEFPCKNCGWDKRMHLVVLQESDEDIENNFVSLKELQSRKRGYRFPLISGKLDIYCPGFKLSKQNQRRQAAEEKRREEESWRKPINHSVLLITASGHVIDIGS